MRFRSKPSEIEAIQWTGENFDEITLFAPEKVNLLHPHLPDKRRLELLAGQDGDTGWVPVPVGDWILHWPGTDISDLWPMNDERFCARYEPVT